MMVDIFITHPHGKIVGSSKQPIPKGFNEIKVNDLGTLAGGTYVLQVITNEGMKSKRFIKLSKR